MRERNPHRRDAILEAAWVLSATRDLEVVSIAELCRASGTTNGSMFHFFPTKEALHAALYLDALSRYQGVVAASFERERSPRAGIRAMVLRHAAWVAAHPVEARLLHEGRRHASPTLDGEIRTHNRAFFARLSAWLAPHVAVRTVQALPADILVALLFGPVHTFTREWLRGSARDGDHGSVAARDDRESATKRRRLEEVAPALADAAWAAVAPARRSRGSATPAHVRTRNPTPTGRKR